jgi:Phage capsid family
MTAAPRLRPDYSPRGSEGLSSFTRACLAVGLSKLSDEGARPEEIAARWGNVRNIEMVLRAAVNPTSVAATAPLAQVATSFLSALTATSAGADLLSRGIQLSFGGAASLTVPGISIPTATFVGELKPIPVVQAVTNTGATLTPSKLAVITTLTGEMMRSPNAEQLVRQVLIESTGPALDAAMFSAAAATTDHPAGLLNGITAKTPAAAGEKAQIIIDDIQQLASAVAPVSGNNSIVLVASPDAAVALVLRLYSALTWPILTSASLAPRTVIAVATNALVSAVDGLPQIDATRDAELHRDSVPAEIVTAGGTVAYPVGSLFQTDQVGLRLRWPLTWGLRSPAGLAWMSNVNW